MKSSFDFGLSLSLKASAQDCTHQSKTRLLCSGRRVLSSQRVALGARIISVLFVLLFLGQAAGFQDFSQNFLTLGKTDFGAILTLEL